MSRRDVQTNEANEFQKFMRFFCMRFVQAVVHSRMDVPMDQPCIPAPDNIEWFNFKQDEFGEVSAYLKTTVKKYPPLIPALAIEFFLHTAGGDNLPLESWVVRVLSMEVDENVNIYQTLYHQLGTLLKSVCAAARVTPTARHYVRNQSDKTYVLCYRVSDMEPDVELLGPERKSMRLGNYPSPFGLVQLDFCYRTRMELSLPPFIEDSHHQHLSDDKCGIFVKASIPISKPSGPKQRLILFNDAKPKAKNWFNPLSEELPFIADMSRPRNPSSSSAGSDHGIPAIYQNLPAELLAAMPADIKSPRLSECEATPNSLESVNSQKKEFPFSSLARSVNSEDNNGVKAKDLNVSNEIQSITSSSSGSKRFDSETSSSASSSLRDMVRNKQRIQDELFGFIDEDEDYSIPSVSSPSTILPALSNDVDDFGDDLNLFVKEMSSAPSSIKSFDLDELKLLDQQIEHFKGKTNGFDNFVKSMKV
ncbi:unnamed protein product [Bursaphelenchus xylophilus]|uniref:(pine wood nematode) hypothetical protein n=1 Tax=Bursaphelenchus xylophilus TaxID=6326 RepID=A0A1I7RR58_BURXY|nr:unnamed protein product [Bursaphelenchus xylophilus]CAG9130849.1 unnamed protein product [Bursaphelenchus xylophilus]